MCTTSDNVQLRRKHTFFCESSVKRAVPKLDGGYSWESLWLALEGHTIHIYKEKGPKKKHLGTLTINDDTVFTVKRYDKKVGYQFKLTTGKHCNKFATGKKCEREQWQAYIVGLTTRKVPENLDLLPVDISRIQADIETCIAKRVSDLTADSGIASGNGSITDKENSAAYQNQSWFFGYCPRDQAEIILTVGANYGNTLMRKRIFGTEEGTFAISKRSWNKSDVIFDHILVRETETGYRLLMYDAQEEKKSLLDIMNYFVELTGGCECTRLMETNDPKQLGLDYPIYSTKISLEAAKSNKRKEMPLPPIPRQPANQFPPIPCEGLSQKPRPFLKSNSEGQFEGLRQHKSHVCTDESYLLAPKYEMKSDKDIGGSGEARACQRNFKNMKLNMNVSTEPDMMSELIPSSVTSLCHRCRSEPCIHDPKDTSEGIKGLSGSREDFKSKLERLFDGSQTETFTVATDTSRTVSSSLDTDSDNRNTHIYANTTVIK